MQKQCWSPSWKTPTKSFILPQGAIIFVVMLVMIIAPKVPY